MDMPEEHIAPQHLEQLQQIETDSIQRELDDAERPIFLMHILCDGIREARLIILEIR